MAKTLVLRDAPNGAGIRFMRPTYISTHIAQEAVAALVNEAPMALSGDPIMIFKISGVTQELNEITIDGETYFPNVVWSKLIGTNLYVAFSSLYAYKVFAETQDNIELVVTTDENLGESEYLSAAATNFEGDCYNLEDLVVAPDYNGEELTGGWFTFTDSHTGDRYKAYVRAPGWAVQSMDRSEGWTFWNLDFADGVESICYGAKSGSRYDLARITIGMTGGNPRSTRMTTIVNITDGTSYYPFFYAMLIDTPSDSSLTPLGGANPQTFLGAKSAYNGFTVNAAYTLPDYGVGPDDSAYWQSLSQRQRMMNAWWGPAGLGHVTVGKGQQAIKFGNVYIGPVASSDAFKIAGQLIYGTNMHELTASSNSFVVATYEYEGWGYTDGTLLAAGNYTITATPLDESNNGSIKVFRLSSSSNGVVAPVEGYEGRFTGSSDPAVVPISVDGTTGIIIVVDNSATNGVRVEINPAT